MGSTDQLFCPHCGAFYPSHARFCPACGSAIDTESGRINTPPLPPLEMHMTPAPPSASQAHITTDPDVSAAVSSILPIIRRKPLKERYRLVREIGSGGYGVVYKAMDLQFGNRLVAVKEMSQEGLNPADLNPAIEAFKHEAFLLAGLTHPGLPSIYDYFGENKRWYLVMSFIEGETLEDYLNRVRGGRVSVDKVFQISMQLAAVLSYLHARKPSVIFRDLKPSNIMRTYEGQIYLIDFGIARHFKPGQLKDTMILGSPGYAAPEQYGRSQTSPQADIYSLGVTMHQMLSGMDPSQFAFQFPRLSVPEYPQLSDLIACMLDVDPKKRPASVGNIKRELQRISMNRVQPARPSSSGKARQRSAPPRHPAPPVAASQWYERYGND